MKVLKFPFSKKDYSKIKQKNNICINVFCYENSLNYPVYVSNERFIDCMDLSMITGENKSHYVYKDFDRFMCNYTKNKNKDFCKYCLQCLSSERVLVEHKETCLEINGKQTVKLRWDSIKFKNHFKQLVATFEIYVDFESPLKGLDVMIKIIVLHILKKVKIIFLAVLLIKLCVMTDLTSHLFFTEEKVQFIDLLKKFFKSMIIVKI